MLNSIPEFVSIIFYCTTLVTLVFFFLMIKDKNIFRKPLFVVMGCLFWLLIQALLAVNGFYYSNTSTLPPKLMVVGVAPLFIVMGVMFNTSYGKRFIDSISLYYTTLLSIVRIPVELCLYWLFIGNAIPEIMTFSGLNFDILAGFTAPLVAYLYFSKGRINKKILLIWNILGLCLLLTIICLAVLSFPFPFQQLAFDQPNIGLLYFPFVWLPTFVAPLVLFGHLVSIRQLLKKT